MREDQREQKRTPMLCNPDPLEGGVPKGQKRGKLGTTPEFRTGGYFQHGGEQGGKKGGEKKPERVVYRGVGLHTRNLIIEPPSVSVIKIAKFNHDV